MVKFKRVSNSDGMCEDGSSLAIMLDHRSTAGFIGRRPYSVTVNLQLTLSEFVCIIIKYNLYPRTTGFDFFLALF